MPTFCPLSLTSLRSVGQGSRRAARGLLILATASTALAAAGCDYQLQLQPTTTPTPAAGSALHVRQVAGQPQLQTADGTPSASLIDQAVQRYLSVSASQQPAQPTLPPLPGGGYAGDAGAPVASSVAPPAPAAPGGLAAAVATPPAAIYPSTGSSRNTASLGGTPTPTGTAPAPSSTPGPASANSRSAAFRSNAPATSGPALRNAASAAQTATPTPPPTQQPAPPPAVAPTQPPPTPKPAPQPVSIFLHEGANDFVYVGPTLPSNQAFAHLAGMFEVVYVTALGTGQTLVYRPGVDPPAQISYGSWVRVNMKAGQGTMFTMYPPN